VLEKGGGGGGVLGFGGCGFLGGFLMDDKKG
jgi:hypothetical protein